MFKKNRYFGIVLKIERVNSSKEKKKKKRKNVSSVSLIENRGNNAASTMFLLEFILENLIKEKKKKGIFKKIFFDFKNKCIREIRKRIIQRIISSW